MKYSTRAEEKILGLVNSDIRIGIRHFPAYRNDM